MKKRKKPVQVVSGRWYAIATSKDNNKYIEECCDCGLVHRIDYKIENGRIWQRWTVDAAETRKARRDEQKFVRRKSK